MVRMDQILQRKPNKLFKKENYMVSEIIYKLYYIKSINTLLININVRISHFLLRYKYTDNENVLYQYSVLLNIA